MGNSTQHMPNNYVRPCPIAPCCLLNNVPDGPESTTGSQSIPTPAPAQSSSSSHTPSIIGPVVAGVVGGVLALTLISVAVVLFLRRRRRRQRGTSVKLVPTTLDPVDLLLEGKGAKIYPLYPPSSHGTLLYVSHVPAHQ